MFLLFLLFGFFFNGCLRLHYNQKKNHISAWTSHLDWQNKKLANAVQRERHAVDANKDKMAAARFGLSL